MVAGMASGLRDRGRPRRHEAPGRRRRRGTSTSIIGPIGRASQRHRGAARHDRRGRRGAAMRRGGEIGAVGFGIPSLIDQRAGRRGLDRAPPDRATCPFRDLMAERLGLPVAVDNDANAAMLAERRAGAAQGATDALLLTIGTGIGGGDGRRRRGCCAGRMARPASSATWSIDIDGPPCPGGCPTAAAWRRSSSGHRAGARGARASPRRPDSALGRAGWRRAAPITGRWSPSSPTTATRSPRRCIAASAAASGSGQPSSTSFNPEVVVVGGGVLGARRAAARAGARGVARRARCRRRATLVQIVPRASAPSRA